MTEQYELSEVRRIKLDEAVKYLENLGFKVETKINAKLKTGDHKNPRIEYIPIIRIEAEAEIRD